MVEGKFVLFSSLVIAFGLSAGCRQVLGIEPIAFEEEVVSAVGNQGSLAIDPSETGTSEAESVEDAGVGERETENIPEGEDSEPPEAEEFDSRTPRPDNESDPRPPPAPRPPPPPPPPPAAEEVCEEYCENVAMSCFRENMQYITFDICLDTCELFAEAETNVDAESSVNTLACRSRNAKLAAIDPFRHCQTAGPLGNDACGDNCASFCDLMMDTCREDNTSEDGYYVSHKACMDDCSELPDLEFYSVAPPEQMSRGNTVQCRMVHASASILAPEEYCVEARGGELCVGEYMRPSHLPPRGGGGGGGPPGGGPPRGGDGPPPPPR